MAQLGFYIKSSDCTGCKACELACKDKHSLNIGARPRRVREVCGGGWVQEENGNYVPDGVYSYAVSFSCGHCDEPACAAACPTGACAKDPDTGLVLIDREVCIGCGACADACPYEAPHVVDRLGKSEKCDMCHDLMAYGEEPACVAICPQRALFVGDIEELRAEFGDIADVQPLPSSELTHPNVVIAPHRQARFDGDAVRMLSLEQ